MKNVLTVWCGSPENSKFYVKCGLSTENPAVTKPVGVGEIGNNQTADNWNVQECTNLVV